jgi:hypothetical protein
MQSWQHDFSCINYLNSDWNECYHCKCNILKNMNIFEHKAHLYNRLSIKILVYIYTFLCIQQACSFSLVIYTHQSTEHTVVLHSIVILINYQ